jgi:hypothetical protein
MEAVQPDTDLCGELLDMSRYVMSTCGLLQLDGGAGTVVAWSGQSNPKLAIEATLVRPFRSPTKIEIVSSRMLIEYPDVGFSLFVKRGHKNEGLSSDDVVGNLVLEAFQLHYQRATRSAPALVF